MRVRIGLAGQDWNGWMEWLDWIEEWGLRIIRNNRLLMINVSRFPHQFPRRAASHALRFCLWAIVDTRMARAHIFIYRCRQRCCCARYGARRATARAQARAIRIEAQERARAPPMRASQLRCALADVRRCRIIGHAAKEKSERIDI